MIEFHIEPRSGVAPYLQLVHQVRQALRLGLLSEGDRLPKVKEVAAKVAINPNTVLKAYRQLENEGLVSPKPGVGTFVTGTLGTPAVSEHDPLRRELRRWLTAARAAGLDEESIEALFRQTVRSPTEEER
ncbi:GntR family transcriptional regulator [Kitasatospora sp. NPDC088783]|uniref:GntR family transcriptional regulator n=1 Tax=Kitasatospora sp. NPDC088783 TaxID=3364077 RepID=UPI003821D0E3